MKITHLSMIVAIVFCGLTVIALALDNIYPQGFASTPEIEKRSIAGQNIRERSVSTARTRHRGFMHGK